MIRSSSLFFFVCFYCSVFGQVSKISGVINDYQPVVSISGYEIQVQNSSDFNVGDKALLFQMQGAIIDQTNTANFGNILDIANCGNYEFTEICEVLSPTKVLVKHIQRAYSTTGSVQLIRIPVYQSAIVSDTLRAKPWDGSTGGVLSFECAGSLTMAAPIHLEGAGFRGGETTTSDYECVWFINNRSYFYDLPGGEGALKGEGVADYIADKTSGRGAQANGGGGGNDHNSGGGGGANGSNGGLGGDRIRASAFTCNSVAPGIGGKPNLYSNSINKVFLGGGGGAGHEDNPKAGTNGVNGGGIVIIKADTLQANGNTISVKGATNASIALDGGGGGGAGGTVLLDISTFIDPMRILAQGSNGSNVDNLSNENCNGPGGGGSGGVVWLSQRITPLQLDISLDGGIPGKTLKSQQSNCTINGNNGATNGDNGVVLNSLILPQPQAIPLTQETYTLCAFDSIFLEKSWQKTPGVYYDTLKAGCRDSMIETTLNFLSPKTGSFQTSICNGQSITINGNKYDTSVLNGIEVFKNIGPLLCDSTVTVNITVTTIDTAVSNNPPTLSANVLNASYQWIDCRLNKSLQGETNRIFTATKVGQYAVVVTKNGCTDTSACYVVGADQINPRIKLYPNPTNGDFTIDLGLQMETATVQITDVLGQRIRSDVYRNSRFIDMNFHEASAIYLVTIETPRNKTTVKLLKQ